MKRFVVSEGNSVYIEMRVLCAASVESCEELARQFAQANEEAASSVRDGS